MSHQKFLVIVVLILLYLNHFVSAQQRGFVVKVQNAGGQTREINLYDGSYALVIGESDYTSGWDDLPGVKTDVEEVRRVLKTGGFSVESEINLASDALKARINRFISDYGYGQNNRLLIYFAGHGHTQKAFDGRDLGYVVPTDAPLPDKDSIEFRRKAISEDTIRNYARMIEAKHAIFVFDSCFSGKLVSRGDFKVPPVILEDAAYPVRQFITAGAANQIVPDDSIFRKAFVRGLDGEADRNNDKFITGTELAEYLKEKVTNASNRTQTPQYGKIRDIDLDRGDFIFVVGKSPVIPSPLAGEKPKGTDESEIFISSTRGKKSEKVLFAYSVSSGQKITTSEVFLVSSEFGGLIISKLKEKKLIVLSLNEGDLSKEERSQYFGGINSRNDEKALRLLPVALIFSAAIYSLEDLPQYQGLFVSKVSGRFEIIDTENSKTVGSERFDEIRGFGNTQDQARKNALRSAAEGISDSFLNLVKEKSR